MGYERLPGVILALPLEDGLAGVRGCPRPELSDNNALCRRVPAPRLGTQEAALVSHLAVRDAEPAARAGRQETADGARTTEGIPITSHWLEERIFPFQRAFFGVCEEKYL